jgi:hypothetical protein
LETEGAVENTRFSRPRVDFSKTFFGKNAIRQTKAPAVSAPERPSENPQFQIPQAPVQPGAAFKIGVYGERERNERSAARADTLSRASFWYDLFRLYFQTPDPEARRQFGGFFAQRYDYFPVDRQFKGSTVADELNLNGVLRSGRTTTAPLPGAAPKPAQKAGGGAQQQVGWNLHYRSLRVLDPEGTDLKPQQTWLGRIDYTLTAWKNALNFTNGYELGAGQSPKVEFNYLRVNPGEGQYSWVDRNRDSILQIDEMEIAVFRDQASFVRIAVPTTQYIRTDNVLLNQNLRFEPRILWGLSKKKWQKGLSRISTQSTLQINRRSIGGARGVSPWNPFQLNIVDTALVTLNTSMRNVFFFNRANPVWDLSLAQGDNRSQVALTTGFERRRTSDWTVHARANLNRRWSLEADAVQGLRNSDNQAFDTRDFSIGTREYGPKLSWLPNRSFRIVLDVNRMESRNRIGAGEKADQNHWNMELTWNPASKENNRGFRAATSLRAKFTLADIRYTGKPNTAVAFTMLEGLQNGQNLLWSLILDRQLSKNMQMNLNYEGRRTGTGNRLVHVGRAQVRALF